MKLRLLLPAVLISITLIATSSLSAGADPSPQQQITQLKKQLRNARLDKADTQDQLDAANDVISDLSAQNARLQSRIQNWPDPIDIITSRGPDGLWNAMRAIWLAFPTQDPSQLCGYDKSNTPSDGLGLTVTSYFFTRTDGC